MFLYFKCNLLAEANLNGIVWRKQGKPQQSIIIIVSLRECWIAFSLFQTLFVCVKVFIDKCE